MSVTVEESEMLFGPFDEESFFALEKSVQYTKSLRPNGVRSCEFVLFKTKKRNKRIVFVEAKRSLPEEYAAETKERADKLYHEFIQEITEKFRHSLELFSGILLNKYDRDGLPINLNVSDLQDIDFQLILVVKTADASKLPIYSEKLSKSLNAERKIWRIPNVIVLNEVLAIKKHLVFENVL